MEAPLSVSLAGAEKALEHPRIELLLTLEDIFTTAVRRAPIPAHARHVARDEPSRGRRGIAEFEACGGAEGRRGKVVRRGFY